MGAVTWAPELRFDIPGKPHPWKRTQGQGKKRFTDPKTRAWESEVCYRTREASRGRRLLGPVRLELIFHFVIPQSPSGRRKWLKRMGLESLPSVLELPHQQVPDLDNLVKGVKDGITRSQIWKDDAQVAELDARKVWVEHRAEERTSIAIFRLGGR